ncbi:MAG: tRNA 2-selenouridine(34) synthase MnmH, partial [Burkholderiales bacterium]|nr:tRNA 2-selenouridine(34) synthase MnmH [Burkholderiales bacterium]
VARNIADIIEREFADRPKSWRPMIYCWRGGMRSLSLAIWMRMIGWRAVQLTGGYKTWRRYVVKTLSEKPAGYRWRVICGATGSAKTAVLTALARHGAQTLDLEALAAHKGSVLGDIPNLPQPSQKLFETRLMTRLAAFDPNLPVYVEAESRKIGIIALPNALVDAIRRAPCLEICAPIEARLDYLLRDYRYLGDNPHTLVAALTRLRGLIDNETLARWLILAEQKKLPELFRELLMRHYDPLYARSQSKHFEALRHASLFATDDLSESAIDTLARQILSSDPSLT